MEPGIVVSRIEDAMPHDTKPPHGLAREPNPPGELDHDGDISDRDPLDLGRLWQTHSPRALIHARALSMQFDPEDVVSEAFVRVIHSLRNGVGPTTHFGGYLKAAVRSVIFSWSHQRREVTIEAELWAVLPSNLDTEAVLDVLELRRIFQTLSPGRQRALWLAEVQGLATREIGRELGISADAAAVLLHRARNDLKTRWRLLAEPGHEYPPSRGGTNG